MNTLDVLESLRKDLYLSKAMRRVQDTVTDNVVLPQKQVRQKETRQPNKKSEKDLSLTRSSNQFEEKPHALDIFV